MHTPLHRFKSGLTLLEILIVLGLMTIIGSLTVFVSLSTYRDSSFHTDRATLIAALQHARAESIDDVCRGPACIAGMSHGVSIQSGRFVIFQGGSYVSRYEGADQVIEANPTIMRTGLTEVIFATSSGNALVAGTITLTDTNDHSSTITIGSDGQIIWSN